jgi:hypothetical protein
LIENYTAIVVGCLAKNLYQSVLIVVEIAKLEDDLVSNGFSFRI